MVKKTKTKKKQKTERPRGTKKETPMISKEERSSIAGEWRTIFDAIKDAVSIINVEGSIIRCNKAMLELISKPFPEIIGRKCWELMHGSTKPIPECPIRPHEKIPEKGNP
jgi:PAS domain-containing protein